MKIENLTIIILLFLALPNCVDQIRSKNDNKAIQEESYWNTNLDTAKFMPYRIEDMDKVPVSDTVMIKLYAHSEEKGNLRDIFNQDHKEFILKFINKYKIPIEYVSIGAPTSGYVDGVGVYVKDKLWLNAREHSARIHSRKKTFQPPMSNEDLDRFFITNFEFTQEMLEAGIHGRVGVGFEVYPDSTLNIFQIMNTTLGIDKEIARVLHSTGKWIPAYDSITNNNIVSEMVYPFPIQHPDSAKLEPMK